MSCNMPSSLVTTQLGSHPTEGNFTENYILNIPETTQTNQERLILKTMATLKLIKYNFNLKDNLQVKNHCMTHFRWVER